MLHLSLPNHSLPNTPRIFSSEEPLPDAKVLQKEIGLLTEAVDQRDLSSAIDSMKRLVPEYNPING